MVEVLGSQHEGNIELTGRETELTEDGVDQLVESCLSKVCIDSSDSDGVIVVPESTLGLTVRVVVVLELSRECNIFGPTIPRSTRVGTVQMNGRGVGVDVDESNDCLTTSGHLESMTWGDGTVSSECGGTQVGVDLKSECRDVVLKVVNLRGLAMRCWSCLYI